jgi:4-amino-4-deoxychorismate lyase
MTAQIRTLINGIAAEYLAADDRSIQFGDGLFETMLVRDGRVIQLAEHLDRLHVSAQRLSISMPQRPVFIDDIDKLIDEAGSACGVIKLIVTRGRSSRGYQYDRQAGSNRLVRFSAIQRQYSSIISAELLRGDLCFCNTPASVNTALAGMKHLNRLDNVLARNEFAADRYIDGLMSDVDGHIIEGSMSNLFAIRDRVLYTPDLGRAGVDGVMRNTVLELAGQAGIEYSVCTLTRPELEQMDCLFITNSLIGMKAVDNLEDTHYSDFSLCEQLFEQLLTYLKQSEVSA